MPLCAWILSRKLMNMQQFDAEYPALTGSARLICILGSRTQNTKRIFETRLLQRCLRLALPVSGISIYAS